MLNVLWTYEFPPERVSMGAFATLLGDRILWQAFGHGLEAISTDGEAVWHRPSTGSTPFFGWKDRIYIGGDRAESLDVSTGTVLAMRDGPLPVRVAAPTSEYARYWEPQGEGSRKEALLGLSLEDLSLQWAVPPPAGRVKWIGEWYYEYDESTSQATVRRPPDTEPKGQFHIDAALWYFQPLMTADVLIFRTPDNIQAIDAFDGRTLWSRAAPEGFGFDRAIDGTFYFFSHTLSAVDPRTGRDLWSLETEAPATDFAVAGEALWVSTRNHRLRAVDRRTGQVMSAPLDTGTGVFVQKTWALTAEDLIFLLAYPAENREGVRRISVR
jgi:outer membrane protein assembly factor BamB